MGTQLRASPAAALALGGCILGGPVAGLAAPPPPAPFTFRTVALSEQQAPGTAPGVTYNALGDNYPWIGGFGQASFSAFPLAGPGVDNTNSVASFGGAPGAVSLIARVGSQAPDTSAGTVYSNFGFLQPFINSSGNVAFLSQLSGPDVDPGRNGQGIFAGPPGAVRLLAREGDAAPGTGAGVNYSSLQSGLRRLNNAGQAVFQGSLTGPGVVVHGNDTAVWLGTPGNVRLVAREGDPAPGLGGVQYGQLFFSLTTPDVNNTGQVSFAALLKARAGSDIAIIAGPPDALALVARTGNPAPGAPNGEVFQDLRQRPGDLNDAGQVAFQGIVNSGQGIWAGTPGALQLVALGGQHAPGTPAGINYDRIGMGFPDLGGGGAVAFDADLADGGSGVWAGMPGALHLLGRSGQDVPGAPAGVHFASQFSGPDVNASGQVVFTATLSGAGVSQVNNVALFFADPSGDVTMVLRTGDPFDVGGGDLRTIQSLGFASAPGGLNDAGQFSFRASFTDGSSGVFVTAVPEPAGLWVLSVIGTTLCARRRRARGANDSCVGNAVH